MKKVTVTLFVFLGTLSLLTLMAAAQPGDSDLIYVVQTDDTLWKLAEKYLGDGNLYPDIVSTTNSKTDADPSFSTIIDPNVLVPGQKVAIPSPVSALPSQSTAPSVNQRTVPDTSATSAAPIQAAIGGNTAPAGQIAFSFWNPSPERCTYEINVVNVPDCLQGAGQCQAARRIIPLNNISEPALHPNGLRIAFRGWGEPPNTNSPYLDCASAHPYRHLGNSTLDGTEFISVGGFWEDSHPDWSPDGSQIIFDTQRNGDGIDRLMVVGADGMNETNVLIAGQHPSWAQDGYHFVYRGCDLSGNRCGLWKAAAYDPLSWNAGQNMLGPVVETSDVAHPDWSPVRDEIVYQKLEDNNWNLWIVNADGTNNRPLLATPGLEGLPSWSPDGNWVAYLTHNGQNFAIHVVSRDGQTDHNIFTYDGGVYTVPKPAEPYGQRDWIDEQISWGP